ncbi:orotate phosphoribosyltransferase [Candidatus Nomurabacteria bacterium RIFCSPHIGHO2_01_FULL_42_15]|uniref:Orotate phosphoribosyltransferase n=1 Tax=Candidatus Nomurabacteria bacterium RIFCSPHIGHO2_01_FULL_42_15 TaxID=1801742 RepID=A0A1F6VDS5_9BACT|nr:MAG: orotate phosphoribosyltransferase [Candidatus Nomurabacteria bacterium RIFCSPHIGHO2_01_FULL_42_15]OGI92917.1 MAG: orotate phosphoribosyltransferase [Candidatus Nomurabacteria bacterium RIFCSPLOWO2_01_FULL_41_18]
MNTEQKVARALLSIGAVGFVPDNPITFKSGIVSPVYIDNRKLPFHPKEWKVIIEGFAKIIKKEKIKAEVIAGVEAAGIPHSAALGFFTKTSSVFVRKEAKDHGTKKMIEGGSVLNRHVLLVEDLVTTGGSSLGAVHHVRKGGGKISHCLVIVSYNFPSSKEAFHNAKMKLHAITSFPVILDEAKKLGIIQGKTLAKIEDWFQEHTGHTK